MKQGDEELQNNIEAGKASDGLDARAYTAIFRVLKKEPGYELPVDFADRVIVRVMHPKKRGHLNDYLFFGAGMVLLVSAFVATVFLTGFQLTGFQLNLGFLKTMADYKGLAVFGIAFILLLNLVDKKLIREKQSHHQL